jgi:DNA-binding NtrC family response regulator
MPRRIECVALTCFTSEFSTWATILGYSGIRLHRAETLEEADFCLTATGATVLLTDVTFLDGTWRDALRMAAGTHPLVAALVVADAVDEAALADAYTRGACAVLWKPIDFIAAIEWIRTVNQAACDRAEWLAERPYAHAEGRG